MSSERTQWTATLEAKAWRKHWSLNANWADRDLGANTCRHEGCDRKTIFVLCRNCYAVGFKRATMRTGYKDWVYHHTAYLRSLSDPAVLGYYPRGGA